MSGGHLQLFAQNSDTGVAAEITEPLEMWYIGKPIVDIRFEGLQTFQENEITPIIASYIDKTFTDAILQDMQRRLYALDYFAEIIPRAEDASQSQDRSEVRLVFEVRENALVSSIFFEGNQRIPNGVLRQEILLKRDDILTTAQIRSDISVLKILYSGRGFPNVEITFRVEDDNRRGNYKNVYFDIAEGIQNVVREINFQGNDSITAGALAGIIRTKKQSLFSRGELSDTTLEQDKLLIEQHYQEQGFIDAQVIDIRQSEIESEEEDRIVYNLDIAIVEGAQYTLGTVTFSGNQIYADDTLQDLLRMKQGDLLNLKRLEADYQAVVNLYYDNGYIFNTIARSEIRDTESNEIAYQINITERDRAHIERIVVRGNTKTKDEVILRELQFEVGEVFSATRIRQGILSLYNLQFFSNILPETPPGSEEGLMELIINVEEGQTADIRFGLVFGGTSEFPISLQLGWQDRNFLGEGFTLGADLTLSFSQQSIAFTFVEPWLANTRVSLQTDLSLSRTTVSGIRQDIIAPIFADNDANAVPDPFTGEWVFSNDTEYNGVDYDAGDPFPGIPAENDTETYDLVSDYEFAGGESALISEEHLMEYILWGAQVGINVGYRIPTVAGLVRIGTGVSSRIESVEYNNAVFRPFDPLLRAGLNTVSWVNSLALRAALDSRDIFYNPSSGYYLGQVLTFTGGFLFGNRHYIRTDSRGEFYVTLFDIPATDEWNFKLVFGFQTLFSSVLPHFYIPASYAEDPQPVASSQDLLYIDGVFYGRGWPRQLNGEALWDTVFEIKMPLAERIIWLDLFFEGASLWDDLDTLPTVNLLENLRFTFGGGIRFTIPQFPIRLYFVKRFNVSAGNVVWQTSPLFNGANVPGGGLDFVFSIGTELF